MSAPRPAPPTRLIEPGTYTPPRSGIGPGGLIDIRSLPMGPRPGEPRRIAVTAVGALPGTEFDGLETADLDLALPGAVLLTYAPTDPPDYRPGLFCAAVMLALNHFLQLLHDPAAPHRARRTLDRLLTS